MSSVKKQVAVTLRSSSSSRATPLSAFFMAAVVSAPLTATASGVGIMASITRTFVSVSLPVVSIGAVNIVVSPSGWGGGEW